MLKKSLQPVCIVSALNSSCFIKNTGGKMNFFKSGSDILPTDITDRAHTEKYRNEGGSIVGNFLPWQVPSGLQRLLLMQC